MQKINWANGEEGGTPLSDTNLNLMEDYIEEGIESFAAENYSSNATYEVGEFCIYNHILYRCITAIETAEEFDETKWEQTNVSVELYNNKNATEGVASRVTELEKEKNLIFVERNSNWSPTVNNTYQTIPFNVTVKKIGNNFNLNSGVITIGSDISVIMVTIRLGVVKAAAGIVYSRILHKHNGSTSSDYTVNQYGGANQRTGINSQYIYNVSEGDTIEIQTYGSTSDVVTGGSGISYLTIEQII